jgi:hypothetical protein
MGQPKAPIASAIVRGNVAGVANVMAGSCFLKTGVSSRSQLAVNRLGEKGLAGGSLLAIEQG